MEAAKGPASSVTKPTRYLSPPPWDDAGGAGATIRAGAVHSAIATRAHTRLDCRIAASSSSRRAEVSHHYVGAHLLSRGDAVPIRRIASPAPVRPSATNPWVPRRREDRRR